MLPYYLLPVPLGLIAAFIYVYWDYRRHKAPLVAENPGNHYSLWHHLKVVTLPIFKYRISLVVSKSEPAQPLVVKQPTPQPTPALASQPVTPVQPQAVSQSTPVVTANIPPSPPPPTQ